MAKKYTLSGSTKVPYVYRCSHCGQWNIGMHGLQCSVSFNGAMSQGGQEQRKAAATDKLHEMLDSKRQETIAGCARGDVRQLDLTASCTSCKKVRSGPESAIASRPGWVL